MDTLLTSQAVRLADDRQGMLGNIAVVLGWEL
jgi:hypothetical protein